MRLGNLKIPVFAVAVAIGTCGPAQAQGQLDLEDLEEIYLHLDDLSQDMAEEYLDILESLQDVLDDYTDYMEEQPDEDTSHHLTSVEHIKRNLRQGSYTSNPDDLLDDLYDAIDEIKSIENRHRVKFNTNTPRCCRLARSLRRELVIIAELVEDYSDQAGDQLLRGFDLKEFFEAAVKLAQDTDQLERLREEHLLEVLTALEALELLGQITIDGERIILDLPDAPALPRPPRPPRVGYEPRRGDKKVGVSYQSQSTMDVTNSSWPIVIDHPSGHITITGADTDQIKATFELEVSSSSRAKEKAFMESTSLDVGEEAGRYYVSVDMPRLSDHTTDVLSSQLSVEIPRSNRVVCTSSFGDIVVSDLSAAVVVEGKNSAIDLSEIYGDVEVSNSMGSIMLTDVRGQVEAVTSYGPIELSDCQGDIVLENEYGTISLRDSEGQLEIENTGRIEISDHVGNLTIENLYGRVEVEDIDGDVIIRNGYEPIVVSDVSGSVELENSYAEITAKDIGGSLAASNSYGPIYVQSLDGPVDLYNHNGNISLVLSPDFRGGSTITSTDGTVKISFVEPPDLVLSAHTVGGSISSSLPISVRTRGDSKSAELVLGEGGERLELSGSNSTIIIRGR